MNKLKNNVIRSIPNLHQDMKVEHGKILSAIKSNQIQETKAVKYIDLELKRKINTSIRENITSVSSERQQPKKAEKIDGKVATIVELIKQDLLPILNNQNNRIEKLERRIKVKNDPEDDSNLCQFSIIADKKSNSVVENEIQNLSVSVDEINKNLTRLDKFVKYQFVKSKCQPSEIQENKNKMSGSQISDKYKTECSQQQMETQQTTQQIQQYLTVQLQEIKHWINKSSIQQQKEIEVKLNLMETQFYQFLYQPLEVLRQLQTNQMDFQIKIKQMEQLLNPQVDVNCIKNEINHDVNTIHNGHFYLKDSFQKVVEENLKDMQSQYCTECHTQLQFNDINQIKISQQIMHHIFDEQIKKLIELKIDIRQCLKCQFYYINDQLCETQQNMLNQLISSLYYLYQHTIFIMGCNAQKGIKNLKSHISTQPVEQFEESGTLCHICKVNLKQESIYLDTCGHSYHSKCMISLIEKQVDVKKQNVIKCTCGTKTTTNQIRQSTLPNKLILLNSLFRKQLEILLKQLRKKPDFNLILQQFETSAQHPDFYFFPNQNQLEYEETPF
ncbi:unnamed protein product (macronuclear) [Paramecium tetraurelia]|uniref:RING-type domain-containing protein n=1 Tax=Paramecium tetraurelia TaxID=5888 RepID=A0BEZ3_PARTE|nr:uncharacterized protein GSPATT00028145001 [Paramecium tetraurelia]CAK57110.1 unnamed protein product [Paramecium tetraurelia]|eukprot:XP_001424508.1 hypothetical protein (macronuclear) [Paramecium tetraurelia strain d4-2]